MGFSLKTIQCRPNKLHVLVTHLYNLAWYVLCSFPPIFFTNLFTDFFHQYFFHRYFYRFFFTDFFHQYFSLFFTDFVHWLFTDYLTDFFHRFFFIDFFSPICLPIFFHRFWVSGFKNTCNYKCLTKCNYIWEDLTSWLNHGNTICPWVICIGSIVSTTCFQMSSQIFLPRRCKVGCI